MSTRRSNGKNSRHVAWWMIRVVNAVLLWQQGWCAVVWCGVQSMLVCKPADAYEHVTCVCLRTTPTLLPTKAHPSLKAAPGADICCRLTHTWYLWQIGNIGFGAFNLTLNLNLNEAIISYQKRHHILVTAVGLTLFAWVTVMRTSPACWKGYRPDRTSHSMWPVAQTATAQHNTSSLQRLTVLRPVNMGHAVHMRQKVVPASVVC
jgi:hypothetical protein